MKKYEMKDLEKTVKVLNAFFSGEEKYVEAFLALLEYSLKSDSQIIFREKGTIVGVSRPDSMFHFYISRSDFGYFIKFKNRDSKMPFDPENIETYFKDCMDVIELLKDNPRYRLSHGRGDGGIEADQSLTEQKIAECSELLTKCRALFLANGDMPLSAELFGKRAHNALFANGVITYGDLCKLNAAQIFRFRNIGKESIEKISEGCRILLDEIHPEDIMLGTSIEANVWEPVRKRTGQLLLDKEIHFRQNEKTDMLCNSFYDDLILCIRKLLESGALATERDGNIVILRDIEKKPLRKIAPLYSISAERVRQISLKCKRKILNGISGKRVVKAREFYRTINRMIENVPDEDYLSCLSRVREEGGFIWDILLRIAADELQRDELNRVLDRLHHFENNNDGNSGDHGISHGDVLMKESFCDTERMKQLEYILTLKEGIDPDTGEILEDDHIVLRTQTLKILDIAQKK